MLNGRCSRALLPIFAVSTVANKRSVPSAAAPSLIPATIAASVVLIAAGAALWLGRESPDPDSTRFLLLAVGVPALVACVGVALATWRDYRSAEVGWLIAALFIVSALAVLPAAAHDPSEASRLWLAPLIPWLGLLLGGLFFAAVIWPLGELITAPWCKPSRSRLWTCAAVLVFSASFALVPIVFASLSGPPSRGQGLSLWLAIFFLPTVEVRDQGALWILRAVVAVALTFAVIAYRAHVAETRLTRLPRSGSGRRKKHNRYSPQR